MLAPNGRPRAVSVIHPADPVAATAGNDVDNADGDCGDNVVCNLSEMLMDETHADVEKEKHGYVAGYHPCKPSSSCCHCDVCRAGLH